MGLDETAPAQSTGASAWPGSMELAPTHPTDNHLPLIVPELCEVKEEAAEVAMVLE